MKNHKKAPERTYKRARITECIPVLCSVLLICVALVWPSLLWAETDQVPESVEERHSRMISIDPFVPFVEPPPPDKGRGQRGTQPGVEGTMEMPEKPVFRTPLERLGIGEIRLVGIVIGAGRRLAVVQDKKGTTYDLYSGTAVGMDEGRVLEILADRVIIEEKKINASGELQAQRTILRIEESNDTGSDDRGEL